MLTQLDVKNGAENHVINVHRSYRLTINDVNPWHLESVFQFSQSRKRFILFYDIIVFVVVVVMVGW